MLDVWCLPTRILIIKCVLSNSAKLQNLPYSCSQSRESDEGYRTEATVNVAAVLPSSSLSPLFLISQLVSFSHFLLILLNGSFCKFWLQKFSLIWWQSFNSPNEIKTLGHRCWKIQTIRILIVINHVIQDPSSYALWSLSHFVFVDGLTHWSLTGSTMTDEDTFMGFSDGLSQSGISEIILILKNKMQNAVRDRNDILFVVSGVSRGGDDSLRPSNLHSTGGCGFSPACGQMAFPAEECLGWLFIHTGGTFCLDSPLV